MTLAGLVNVDGEQIIEDWFGSDFNRRYHSTRKSYLTQVATYK
jgi:hypothetical protein